MQYYVYILRCADGSYYVGHTEDVARRVEEHRTGRGGKYTRQRRPIALVHVEELPTKIAAVRREKEIKGWSRSKKEALFK